MSKAKEYDNQTYWQALHKADRGRLSAVGYVGMGEGFNLAAYRLRRAAVARALNRAGGEVNEVLEGAVGVGAYAPLWAQRGVRRWTGVDISPLATKDLAEKYPEHEFLAADLTAADWGRALQDRKFDLVTAIDVLYHIIDDAAFARTLGGLAARVREGGLLLVSDVFCEPARQTAPHVKRRSLCDYEAALRGRGLEMVAREPVFAVLGDPVVRPHRPPLDVLCFQVWRVAAKLICLSPAAVRDATGSALVKALTPLDAWLRAAGAARGVNLELALFRQRRPVAD
jgi:2-polyprenyl-3-methyl-5-hydroxy-6-metoxy-1,4-benzoquinol methylase